MKQHLKEALRFWPAFVMIFAISGSAIFLSSHEFSEHTTKIITTAFKVDIPIIALIMFWRIKKFFDVDCESSGPQYWHYLDGSERENIWNEYEMEKKKYENILDELKKKIREKVEFEGKLRKEMGMEMMELGSVSKGVKFEWTIKNVIRYIGL